MSDRRKSLLSTLLSVGAEPDEIFLAETLDGEWEYAFWNYDPDDLMVAYRCPPGRSIWCPVETPDYTGSATPWESEEGRYGRKPWHGDPDPK